MRDSKDISFLGRYLISMVVLAFAPVAMLFAFNAGCQFKKPLSLNK